MGVQNACDIQHTIIYGYSDGATIALLASALYPGRIKGLVLEGPHCFIENSGKAAVLETRKRARTTSLLDSRAKYHGDKTVELFRLWHETWLGDYFAYWTIVLLLHQICCPVLVFQSEYGEFGSVEQLNILKKEIPTSVAISEMPNAGHTPRKEVKEEVMELVRNWFVENKM
jgi:pimeloyl-ACP methyl ester carboxylesterase